MTLLANCAAPDTTQGTGKLSDAFATPEWAKFSNSKPTAQRAITPDDLVSADGRCAAAPEVVTAQATPEGGPESTSDASSGQGASPAKKSSQAPIRGTQQ